MADLRAILSNVGLELFVAVCFRRNRMTTPFEQRGLIVVFLRILQIIYASPIESLIGFEALPSEERSNRGG